MRCVNTACDCLLQVAHCDHRWRADSAANAEHVAGVGDITVEGGGDLSRGPFLWGAHETGYFVGPLIAPVRWGVRPLGPPDLAISPQI